MHNLFKTHSRTIQVCFVRKDKRSPIWNGLLKKWMDWYVLNNQKKLFHKSMLLYLINFPLMHDLFAFFICLYYLSVYLLGVLDWIEPPQVYIKMWGAITSYFQLIYTRRRRTVDELATIIVLAGQCTQESSSTSVEYITRISLKL